jgi:GT2 family glycosyltransferase
MRPYPTTLAGMHVDPRPVLDDLTVVIPTIGRAILDRCLHEIAIGTAWPARIVVVDQSSSLTIASWLARLQALGLAVEHVPSSQRGRAAAVNRGLERVETRFVAVTDDDCLVERDWLATMVARLRDYPDAIITGRVETEGDEPVLVVVNSSTPAIQWRPRLKCDSMCGGNMGVSLATIRRIGLFDEDPCLRTAEDGEYAYRALCAGIAIVYAPDVAVRHFGWRDLAARTTQYRDYARSHAGFFGKYLRRGDWFIALRIITHFVRALRRWLRGALKADRDLALNGRAYVIELLPGLIAGWRSGKPL